MSTLFILYIRKSCYIYASISIYTIYELHIMYKKLNIYSIYLLKKSIYNIRTIVRVPCIKRVCIRTYMQYIN